ncbi:MAG: hypothetical protein QF903_09115 [Planctomycetota bacterium]|nr:hypothetical protein [Planctomycetota bacterium]MDP6989625.1 hypothetical protein [Planctomycetota bacterium]
MLSPAGTVYLVALLGSTALALKPFPPAERVLDALLLPTRVLPELAAPLAWARASSVRAAEHALAAAAEEEEGRIALALEEARRACLPTDPELLAGRRRIHGEVVGRSPQGLDRVVVRLASLRGVEAGLPVVSGDAYLGRIAALDADGRREATLDLVTGADFLVGARLVATGAGVEGESTARMVVGGLAPRVAAPGAGGSEGGAGAGRSAEDHRLAVHNPSPRNVSFGDVLVDEPRPADHGGLGDRWSWLANGYRLGTLEAAGIGRGRRLLRVRPELDYRGGLHQVIVLAPSAGDGDGEEVGEALATLDPSRWLAARVLAPSSLSPRRDGLRLAAGRWSGVREGAAVAFGARLVGVVEHAGWATADVRLLGDPGLSLTLLARLAGEPAPRSVGEVTVLGRDALGAVRLRWEARLPLGGVGAEPVEAELLTGSGRSGVPAGLLVGHALLPRGAGTHELSVRSDARVERLLRLKVHRALVGEGAAP